MSTGWALWGLVGLNQRNAGGFLREGYYFWSGAGGSSQEATVFLRAVLARLADIHPAVPPTVDLKTVPRQVVDQVQDMYLTRCWAASNLFRLATSTGERTQALDDEVYEILAGIHPAFLSLRGTQDYEELAADRGVAPRQFRWSDGSVT